MKCSVRAVLRALLRLALLCGLAGSAAHAAPAAHTILVFGDSLSAGYGLDADRGWVHLLELRLQAQAPGYTVVNASASGETSAGGLVRLPDALRSYHPQLVLIELGGNDGLRALPLDAMQANLGAMIELCRKAQARPLLFAMQIPPNYGPQYATRFAQSFAEVARKQQITLVPFFLAGIATDPARWFQDDGIHPNAQAQPQLLDAVWATLAPLLKSPRG